MSTLQSLLHTPLFESVGWALIHLTWQATIVALLLGAIITTFRPRSSSTRYLLAVIALTLIATLPLITGYQHYNSVKSGEVSETTLVASGVITASTTQALTVSALSRAALRDVATTLKNDLYVFLTAAVPYLLVLWSLGVALFSVRLVAAWIQARRLTRDGLSPAPAYCIAALERISDSLGLQRGVRLFVSELVEVPSVIGYLRPMVLLPVSCLSGLTIEQLESVIAHELAHVRRYDFVVNFAQTIIETLFFFHPAVWWVSSQIRAERENACDDLAVEVCGDARVYANALTLLEQMRPQFATVSVAATGGNLLSRIKRLLKIDTAPAEQFSTRWFAGLTLATIAAILILVLPFGLAAQASKVLPDSQRSAQKSDRGVQPGITVDVIASQSDSSESDDVDVDIDSDPAVEFEFEHKNDFKFEYEFDASEMEHHVQLASLASQRAEEEMLAAKAALDELQHSEEPCPDALRRAEEEAKLAAKNHKHAEKLARKRVKDIHIDLNNLDERQINVLAQAGVERTLLESLANIGCEKSTLNELKALKNVGVNASFVRSIHSAVEDIESIEQLTQLKALGVDAAYARALRAAGFDVESESISSAKALGITPEFAREMKRRLDVGDIEELSQLRAVGVTSQYLNDLRASGFREFDADDVVGARAVGVTRAFVDALRAAGVREISLDDAVELRAVGITPADVKEYRRIRGSKPTADDVIEEKHRGFRVEVISSLEAQRESLELQRESLERHREAAHQDLLRERDKQRREKETSR